VRDRDTGMAKVVASDVCRLTLCQPSAPPNNAFTRPPCCWCDFSPQRVPTAISVQALVPTGRRVMLAVGLAAFCGCCSSSAPEHSPFQAALRSYRRPHKPRTPSPLVGPPSRSCQPPLPLHSRRVCFAIARLGASPLVARLGTADSCRAWPCGARCQSRCRGCVPTGKLPPRPLRPTLAAADRPVWAIFHLVVCQPSVAVHAPVPAGRPAERHR
jgi:hypothetical protein